jgi:hypothetical protein
MGAGRNNVSDGNTVSGMTTFYFMEIYTYITYLI